MRFDILIKNGHVVDPARGVDKVCDVGIIGNKIVNVNDRESKDAIKTIDAVGCYVFPGLIDFHVHNFYGGTAMGVNPDFLLATGVTASVDAGSSGCCTFRGFHDGVITRSVSRVKAFLSCYSGGLIEGGFYENFDPTLFDKPRIEQLFAEFPDCLLGLKLRLTLKFGLTHDIEPLKAAIAISEQIGGVPVCVHVTDAPCKMTDIVKILRRGDIVCHVYHGTGDTILGEDGHVRPEFREARERGVLFDAANGRSHSSHYVTQVALKEDFLPDILSTDMTNYKLFYGKQGRSLAFVMSKHLSFGMSLFDVVKATTETPARLMKMEGSIGTLAPGAWADVAIFKLSDQKVVYVDTEFKEYQGNGLLVPQATIVNGILAYGNIEFNLEER